MLHKSLFMTVHTGERGELGGYDQCIHVFKKLLKKKTNFIQLKKYEGSHYYFLQINYIIYIPLLKQEKSKKRQD